MQLQYLYLAICRTTLMACFADVNVSQGSVATYARCGGIVGTHLTANLPTIPPTATIQRGSVGSKLTVTCRDEQYDLPLHRHM